MTTAPLADAGARATIAEALDDTLVVEAAAGTGKTTQLVKRIQRATTDHGKEIGIRLPSGSGDLRDGDILHVGDANMIVVSVLPTDILVIEDEPPNTASSADIYASQAIAIAKASGIPGLLEEILGILPAPLRERFSQ